jgi:hypothetical protein
MTPRISTTTVVQNCAFPDDLAYMLFTNVVFPDDVAYSTCLMNQRVLKEQKLLHANYRWSKEQLLKTRAK